MAALGYQLPDWRAPSSNSIRQFSGEDLRDQHRDCGADRPAVFCSVGADKLHRSEQTEPQGGLRPHEMHLPLELRRFLRAEFQKADNDHSAMDRQGQCLLFRGFLTTAGR